MQLTPTDRQPTFPNKSSSDVAKAGMSCQGPEVLYSPPQIFDSSLCRTSIPGLGSAVYRRAAMSVADWGNVLVWASSMQAILDTRVGRWCLCKCMTEQSIHSTYSFLQLTFVVTNSVERALLSSLTAPYGTISLQEHYLEASQASKSGTAAVEAKDMGTSIPAASPTKPMRQAKFLMNT